MMCLECDGRGEVWDEGSNFSWTACPACLGTGYTTQVPKEYLEGQPTKKPVTEATKALLRGRAWHKVGAK